MSQIFLKFQENHKVIKILGQRGNACCGADFGACLALRAHFATPTPRKSRRISDLRTYTRTSAPTRAQRAARERGNSGTRAAQRATGNGNAGCRSRVLIGPGVIRISARVPTIATPIGVWRIVGNFAAKLRVFVVFARLRGDFAGSDTRKCRCTRGNYGNATARRRERDRASTGTRAPCAGRALAAQRMTAQWSRRNAAAPMSLDRLASM